MGFRLWGNIFSTVLWNKNCVLDFSHVRNSIHNTSSGVSMYCLIHHQGSRCINEYIVRGGVVLENVSSPLRFITKYIHFCLFNKVNVIYIYVEFGVVVIKLRSTRGSNCSSRAELARLESCNYCLKCWVIWLLLPQTPRICITSTVSLVAKIIVICVT